MIDTPDARLGDVDLADVATALGQRVRAAGVAVTTEQVGRFVRAVTLVVPVRVDEIGQLARITLARSHDQVEVIDRVISEVFGGADDVADQRGDPTSSGLPPARRSAPPDRRPPVSADPAATAPPAADGGGPTATSAADEADAEAAAEHRLGLAAAGERLATTDFAELTDDELRDVHALMREIRLGVPRRPARRRRRHRHGDELDLRATLRRSRQHGGEPFVRVTRRAQHRPRPLVVLCDISGSMAPYSRACIQLLHAATGATRAEVFTFATRLTRLTRALAVADPDRALARAAAAAPDWKGGTRIGSSLKTFLDEHGRRGVARGAVVVIVSDGWDLDDPSLIAEQMARLRRLAHRIVWINPRTAAPEFQPLAGAMAAALPFCDELVSGHSLTSLAAALSTSLEPDSAPRSAPQRVL